MSAGRFNLSALAVRERSVTLFLIILISVAGLVAFFGLGRAEDPPFTVKQMTVITVWPGATAQEMQDQVAEPLEKRLQELKWYDRTETYTRPGMALITLSLQDQTPPSEVPEQFYQARKKLGDEAKNLPAGVSGPMMNDEFADVTFALFALKARGEPPEEIARFCLLSILAALTGMAGELRRTLGPLPLVFAGGVMSNRLLRQALEERFGGCFAPPAFSADNAAGVAWLCARKREILGKAGGGI